jgi:hypothetical protein
MDAIGWDVDQGPVAAASDSPASAGTASPGAAPTQLAQALAVSGAETPVPVALTAPSGCGETVPPLILAAAPHS